MYASIGFINNLCCFILIIFTTGINKCGNKYDCQNTFFCEVHIYIIICFLIFSVRLFLLIHNCTIGNGTAMNYQLGFSNCLNCVIYSPLGEIGHSEIKDFRNLTFLISATKLHINISKKFKLQDNHDLFKDINQLIKILLIIYWLIGNEFENSMKECEKFTKGPSFYIRSANHF